MSQSKQGSAVEAITNILMGFPINFILNIAILPYTWNPDHVIRSAFITGAVFTVVSFVRQMYIRRWFNSIKASWNTESGSPLFRNWDKRLRRWRRMFDSKEKENA